MTEPSSSDWRIGDAKQRFSEVLRRARVRPQRIFNRDRLVAAVLDASLFEEFEQWQARERRYTLEEDFSELREICREEGYTLEVGERRDRETWIADDDGES